MNVQFVWKHLAWEGRDRFRILQKPRRASQRTLGNYYLGTGAIKTATDSIMTLPCRIMRLNSPPP